MEMKTISATLKKQADIYQIWASTKDVDRDREIIMPTAFKNLKEYLAKNPVILFGHDHWKPPIGKAINGRITDNGLILDIVFAKTTFGEEIKYLYDEGFLNAFSVGFIPKTWDVDPDNRRVYTDVELLEVSAVPVPANAAATMIRAAKSKGVDLPELQKLYTEMPDATQMPEGDTGDRTVSQGKKQSKKVVRYKSFIGEKNVDKITLLKALIAKETDEKEIERLNDLLIEAIREDERAKLEAKIAEEKAEAEKKAAEEKQMKELDEQRKKSLAEGRYTGQKIEVGTPGSYKGVSLKYASDVAIRMFEQNPLLKGAVPIMKSRPEALEKVLKHFTDLYDNAINNVGRTKAALGEGNTGAYLTPTEERAEILAYIRETSVALQDCRLVSMTSDVMTIPREVTKVDVKYTGEATPATQSDPTFDQVTLTATRMDAYSVASNELIQDTQNPGGIVGMLLSQFVEAVGQKVDSTVFACPGNPVSSVFRYAGYSQVFGTGSTSFSALLEADLRAIISKIPTSRLGNAKWYVHRSPAWTYLYGLKDAENRLLFIPSMTQANPHMLYGYPVRMPEMAPAVSGAGKGFIVFGDLRGFMIGERLTNISLFVDPYSKSTSYQTLFLMFTRWAYAHALPQYYGRIATHA